MIPQGFGLVRDLFPPAEMTKVWGVFGPIMGLSAMLGPIIGGGLVDLAGWRSIFLINLPIRRVRVRRRGEVPAVVEADREVEAAGRRRCACWPRWARSC